MSSTFDKQIHLLLIICDLLDVNCIDEYKSNKYDSKYDISTSSFTFVKRKLFHHLGFCSLIL